MKWVHWHDTYTRRSNWRKTARRKSSQFLKCWKSSTTPQMTATSSIILSRSLDDPSATEIIFMDFHACRIAISSRVNKQILSWTLSNALRFLPPLCCYYYIFLWVRLMYWEDDDDNIPHQRHSHFLISTLPQRWLIFIIRDLSA